MKIFWVSFFLCFTLSLNAQEFAVNKIPSKLTEDAYAVVRKDDVKVELSSFSKMKFSHYFVVTVLNESGMNHASFPAHYNKQLKIDKFTAVLYDKDGKEIKKLRSKDLKDVSLYDGFSLFVDTRIQYYEFTPTSFPFTIAYNLEYSSSNTISLPSWYPVGGYNVSVEETSYKLQNSSKTVIRKKENGFDGWNIEKTENGNSLFYSAGNIKAIKQEVMSPHLSEIAPVLKVAPKDFQLEGYGGSVQNWSEFGKWYYDNLIKDKMDLPEKDKQAVNQMLKGIDDPVEKTRILYQYMQSKTRYVNVSIGIGGWEPFPASYVSSKSYGDCKALSNYMISLLKYAGIDAYHSVVYSNFSRKQDLDTEFASLQGNHMIVNVPFENETIWLECTSQQTAFNYLGLGTDDRYVLSVTPDGGKIIKTQQFTVDQNLTKISGTADLLPNGKLNADIQTKYSGLKYNENYYVFYETQKEQITYLNRIYNYLPNLNLINYKFENDRDNAIFEVSTEFESNQYASVIGNSMMMNLIPVGRKEVSVKKDNDRKYPFELRYGYTDELELTLNIPKNYKLSNEFKNIIYTNEFGSYILTVADNKDGSLKVYRKLIVAEGTYPADKFNDFVEFSRTISSFDNTKILLELI